MTRLSITLLVSELALALWMPQDVSSFTTISNHVPTPASYLHHPKIVSLAPRKMTTSDFEGQGPRLNTGLVTQLLLNQAIIGITIWTGGPGYQALVEYANFDEGFVLGILGLIPLLYVSNRVETSESPVVAGLNLSTNMVVLRLFGDRPQPLVALGVSALLGGITGIVEEVTFRGQLLPTIADWSSSSLGWGSGLDLFVGALGSTIIFAVLHTNPLSLLKGGDAARDNFALLVFQLLTGTIFAILFLSTENLAVPIVAHALYDFYTFFKTHLDVTGQMEYAMQERLLPTARFGVEQKWADLRGPAFVEAARETFYLMDTNQDGVLSRKELRVALFSYGINLSKMESARVALIADLDRSGAIDFGEFLEFVGPVGSTSKAVKYAILGPG